MKENNQYYESTIKTSRINNQHKTKWKTKPWAILNNKEIITTTPTTETKDLRCKFVSAKDYLKLRKQLEEKNKMIDEINYIIKLFHKYNNLFKWNQEDYIETIGLIEIVLERGKNE